MAYLFLKALEHEAALLLVHRKRIKLTLAI
jgi:hypothetical protein